MKSRPETTDEFDEDAYLALNPDVKAAVQTGTFKSGWHHYKACGRSEGRSLQPKSRRDRLLFRLDLERMRGLEIGPLMTPLVTKAEGNIVYVDHADTDALRAKYSHHLDPSELSRIVPVDHVWGTQTLADLLGEERVDYVLASHVIEHVPDLVTWLDEIHAVLVPGGALRLAVPDRRYTFDILRAESTLADALDAHIRRARVPQPRAILDHFLHGTEVSARDVWDGKIDPTRLTPTKSAAVALQFAQAAFESGQYLDTHCWVFTPLSFARLGAALARLDRLHFACERIYPTDRHELEFIVALRSSSERSATIDSWDAAVRLLTI